MRRLTLLLVIALLACEADFVTFATTVQWLEWPQEVVAGRSFDVRVIVPAICRSQPVLSDVPQLSDSTITFAPSWRYEHDPNFVCNAYMRDGITTTVALPGLPVPSQGHYAVVTVGPLLSGGPLGVPPGPTDTSVATRFGDLVVRTDSADTSRTNAAGFVRTYHGVGGCTQIYSPWSLGYVIENPVDSAASWAGFVSGYLYRPDTLVCGVSRVFHLVRTS